MEGPQTDVSTFRLIQNYAAPWRNGRTTYVVPCAAWTTAEFAICWKLGPREVLRMRLEASLGPSDVAQPDGALIWFDATNRAYVFGESPYRSNLGRWSRCALLHASLDVSVFYAIRLVVEKRFGRGAAPNDVNVQVTLATGEKRLLLALPASRRPIPGEVVYNSDGTVTMLVADFDRIALSRGAGS